MTKRKVNKVLINREYNNSNYYFCSKLVSFIVANSMCKLFSFRNRPKFDAHLLKLDDDLDY